MKNRFLLLLALFLTILAGTTIGCDKRSQLEKDADKAASKLQGALK